MNPIMKVKSAKELLKMADQKFTFVITERNYGFHYYLTSHTKGKEVRKNDTK